MGKNCAEFNHQLDRLEFLQRIAFSPAVLGDVPAHWVARLRRQGERYYTDGLRGIASSRRLAVFAFCVVEWSAAIAETVVETHDRIVGVDLAGRKENLRCANLTPRMGAYHPHKEYSVAQMKAKDA